MVNDEKYGFEAKKRDKTRGKAGKKMPIGKMPYSCNCASRKPPLKNKALGVRFQISPTRLFNIL